MNKKLSDQFQDIYNQLDNYMRMKLKVDQNVPHSYLIKEASVKDLVIRSMRDDLLQFSQLRNAIVHNPNRVNAHPIAEPHEYIVKKYQNVLNQVLSPAKANTIIVPKEKIYSTSKNKMANEIIKIMNEKFYTHVPVLEDNRLIGVFSENVIFSFLVKYEIVGIDKNLLIDEFKEFIPLDAHLGEFFKFAPIDSLLIDVKKIFETELNDNKRLGAVFFTANGKETEKLLGMVTAWDLAGV